MNFALGGSDDLDKDSALAVEHQEEHEQHDHTPDLVNAFLAMATSEFAPIVSEAAHQWIVRVQHVTPRGLVDVSPDRTVGFFFASATFANNEVAGRLTYGDREYDLDIEVGPAARIGQYGLWEWADALGRLDLVPRDTSFVMTIPRLEGVLRAMVAALRALQSDIAAASPEAFVRLEEARVRRQAAFQDALRQDEHRRASAMAAEAFRAGEYRRATELLESVADLLTPAERAKLAFARRQLG